MATIGALLLILLVAHSIEPDASKSKSEFVLHQDILRGGKIELSSARTQTCLIRKSRIYDLMTDEQFDSAKDLINRAKHKLSLSFGNQIFEDGNHLIIPSIREIDGEERFKVIGVVAGKFFTGLFVWRSQRPRFISVRRSNKNEERAYKAVG